MKECSALLLTRSRKALAAALRREDFDFVAGAFGENFFEEFPFFKIVRNVNCFGKIFGFEIELLQQRGNKFGGMKFFEFFPIKFAAIHNAAGAQVEEIRGNERRFGVVGKNIGVVALRGGNALAFFDVFERAEKIAIGGGLFVEFFFCGGGHALFEAFDEIVAAAFEKQSHVARGFGVALVGGEAGDAGTETAMNVNIAGTAADAGE